MGCTRHMRVARLSPQIALNCRETHGLYTSSPQIFLPALPEPRIPDLKTHNPALLNTPALALFAAAATRRDIMPKLLIVFIEELQQIMTSVCNKYYTQQRACNSELIAGSELPMWTVLTIAYYSLQSISLGGGGGDSCSRHRVFLIAIPSRICVDAPIAQLNFPLHRGS